MLNKKECDICDNSIVAYIECYYNPIRLHSSLNYLSPNTFFSLFLSTYLDKFPLQAYYHETKPFFDMVDLVIAYIDMQEGGAYEAMKYAQLQSKELVVLRRKVNYRMIGKNVDLTE